MPEVQTNPLAEKLEEMVRVAAVEDRGWSASDALEARVPMEEAFAWQRVGTLAAEAAAALRRAQAEGFGGV